MFERAMMETKKNSFSKSSFPQRADIWFLFGVLAAALVLLLIFRLNRAPGSFAEVSYDGDVLMRIPLLQEGAVYYLLTEQGGLQNGESGTGTETKAVGADVEVHGVSTDGSIISIQTFSEPEWKERTETEAAFQGKDYNIILCQNGEIQMLESSCPDLICVHHRAIGGTGENIICLPHKIVIEIVGDKEHELDGVVY